MEGINITTKIPLDTSAELRKIAYSNQKRLTDLYRDVLVEYADRHRGVQTPVAQTQVRQ